MPSTPAPEWLDIDCDAHANVMHAGPLGVTIRPPPPNRANLPRQRVLLTFSTTAMHGQTALIDRVCEAVASLELEAVLTLGAAVGHDAVPVADNVEVMAYADHDRLMPGTAAVIGHGGLGTVLRGLAHGVPRLLLPLGRDQGFNAGRVEQLGAGIRLAPDAPLGRIRAAVRALLDDPRFTAAAARAARHVAADEPDRTAAEALEHTAGRRPTH